MELVRPAVIEGRSELRRQFDQAQPFRHVVIDDFLEPEFCRRLLTEFPTFAATHATNELGEVGRKAVHPNLAQLGAAYVQLDRLLQSAELLNLVGEITGIPKLLYDRSYVGGGTHENLDGQDLDTHVDFNYHPTTGFHRRLNLIVFLNPEWEASWGGLLELQKDPTLPGPENVTRQVIPLENRAVIFETTESSWHGFRRITLPADRLGLSRKSIAVYFYTKERPHANTAPSHGTIYVQQPLPAFIQAGHTLAEVDVHELQVHFARRDAHIKYLYNRELEFSRIAQSPAFRLARALTWPFRKLRDWK